MMEYPITPDAVRQLVSLSGATMSPNGDRWACVRTSVTRRSMASRSVIILGHSETQKKRILGKGPRDTLPKFSPNGTLVAFLRQVKSGPSQIWIVDIEKGEPWQLTNEVGGISEYAWSPDSRKIAYIADSEPLAKAPPEQGVPNVKVVRRIRYRIDSLGWRGDTHRHLFIVDITTKVARQLTNGDGDESGPVWSPDCVSIAFISDERSDRDVVPFTDAYVVPANGGDPVYWSHGLFSVVGVVWSPDGKYLAAIGSQDPDLLPGWQGWLYVLELGKPPRRLTTDSVNPSGGFLPLLKPLELAWTAAGNVLFVGDHQGQSFLWSVPSEGGEMTIIAGGDVLISSIGFDAGFNLALLGVTSVDSTGDLLLVKIKQMETRRIASFNRQYLSGHPRARQDKFTISRKGLEVECRLLFPPVYDPTLKYPMILDIHGGPHGVFNDGFNLTQQVLSTAGYIVLAVNPRGSSTYGSKFAKEVLRDWGGEDYRDIMAAVDLAANRRDVDSYRLGVHGYSYGGYMTCWIIGQNNLFKAAVAGAPCVDLPTLYGTSDIGVSFGEVQWGGLRHENENAWRSRSPISYAQQVETPVLLLHGEEDHRVPIEQSEVYFVSLKRLGKEVELVRFPNCSHSLPRTGHPKMREEYLSRTLEWFNRWLY